MFLSALQNFSDTCMLYSHLKSFACIFYAVWLTEGTQVGMPVHFIWRVSCQLIKMIDWESPGKGGIRGRSAVSSYPCIPEFVLASDKEWQMNCFPGCCFQMSQKWRAKTNGCTQHNKHNCVVGLVLPRRTDDMTAASEWNDMSCCWKHWADQVALTEEKGL